MSSVLLQQAAELKHSELGQNGAILLTDTSAITGNFRKIQVLSNTVFTTLTSNYTVNDDETAATATDFGTVTAGTVLYGKFTAITLTSGSVILYK